jgi:hypothetical protein
LLSDCGADPGTAKKTGNGKRETGCLPLLGPRRPFQGHHRHRRAGVATNAVLLTQQRPTTSPREWTTKGARKQQKRSGVNAYENKTKHPTL